MRGLGSWQNLTLLGFPTISSGARLTDPLKPVLASHWPASCSWFALGANQTWGVVPINPPPLTPPGLCVAPTGPGRPNPTPILRAPHLCPPAGGHGPPETAPGFTICWSPARTWALSGKWREAHFEGSGHCSIWSWRHMQEPPNGTQCRGSYLRFGVLFVHPHTLWVFTEHVFSCTHSPLGFLMWAADL